VTAPAIARPLTWQLARVVETVRENDHAATIRFDVPDWPGHKAGQHVDLRLTAEDGYQTERSYSIASPPEQTDTVDLTIDRIDDGEVSPFLTDVLRAGDDLELRGPIGGYFAWDARDGGPLLLVGGGSGVVPLAAMLRHRSALATEIPARLLVSARTAADLFYWSELQALGARGDGFELHATLTRERPDGWQGYDRRVDEDILREVAWPPADAPHVFVCGPTSFVEAVAESLVALGHRPALVKTERFGPTGG